MFMSLHLFNLHFPAGKCGNIAANIVLWIKCGHAPIEVWIHVQASDFVRSCRFTGWAISDIGGDSSGVEILQGVSC